MIYFDTSLFIAFILLLVYFIEPTYNYETEGLHKGFKTLWRPYTQSYSIQTRDRNYLSDKTTLYRRTTYVSINVDYKPPFWMDLSYDYGDQLPGTQKFPLDDVAASEDYYHSLNFVKQNRAAIQTTKWHRPSLWETPDPPKTIVWSWTTTGQPALRIGNSYPESFYQYLARNVLKRGGTTYNPSPLPTFSPIFGTTNLWRFWSYNMDSLNVDSFPALETEGQPRYRVAATTVKSQKNTSCYVCGLDMPGIPRVPACHHAFEGPDMKYSIRKLKYKRQCFTGTRSEGLPPSKRKWYGKLYRGGCFKRYTDIGVEFDERGCRTMEPFVGISYASKRFARLERTLYDVDDGCIVSPFASLTPFSRAVSLYVRYHVCVCKGRYCNRATSKHTSLKIVVLIWPLFVLRIQYLCP